MARKAAWRATWELVRDAAIEWWQDDALRLGAAIAYYAVFSMGPLLLVVIALAGLWFGREAAQNQLVGTLAQYIGAGGARAIEETIAASGRSGGGKLATLIGIGALLLGATALFDQLEDALNTIWEVPRKRRGFWAVLRSRLLSFSLVLGAGFLLLVSLLITTGLAAASEAIDRAVPGASGLLQIAHALFSFGVVASLFALMFKVLPDVRLAWRDVWVGATFTALLFIFGQTVLGLYIREAAVGSTHGAAGSLVVVLVWVYYSSQIFFFGAELTHLYARRYGSTRPRLPPPPAKR